LTDKVRFVPPLDLADPLPGGAVTEVADRIRGRQREADVALPEMVRERDVVEGGHRPILSAVGVRM
jgi:hypothetical protein